MQLGYMAVGNTGTTLHLTDRNIHPGAQLLKKPGTQHADKMYVDDKEGNAKHIGYIVGGEWFRLYEVHEWQGK